VPFVGCHAGSEVEKHPLACRDGEVVEEADVAEQDQAEACQSSTNPTGASHSH
jgi:hypothetical protein